MKHIEVLLPEYFHEELNEAERASVDAHLGTCADCRRAYEEFSLLFGRTRETTAAPPGGYFSSILPRVRARLDHPTRRPLWASPVAGRFVLPLAVTLLVSFIILRFHDQAGIDPMRPLLEDLSAAEMVDVVTEYAGATDPQMEDVLADLSAPTAVESFIPTEVIRNAFVEGSAAVDPVSLLEDLTDDAFSVVLQKLDERTVLTP